MNSLIGKMASKGIWIFFTAVFFSSCGLESIGYLSPPQVLEPELGEDYKRTWVYTPDYGTENPGFTGYNLYYRIYRLNPIQGTLANQNADRSSLNPGDPINKLIQSKAYRQLASFTSFSAPLVSVPNPVNQSYTFTLDFSDLRALESAPLLNPLEGEPIYEPVVRIFQNDLEVGNPLRVGRSPIQTTDRTRFANLFTDAYRFEGPNDLALKFEPYLKSDWESSGQSNLAVIVVFLVAYGVQLGQSPPDFESEPVLLGTFGPFEIQRN